ncbi:response regulator transcription factor [Halorussus halobius]|uniref:response regulator transcription factor n=1 Tax=Halorussus halobius TaxID=1710537 RepID=UPI001093194A|nr:response regulator [Halorussus halobius]
MTDTDTVLVVDDNRPLADGFARALATDYDVRTAYTVEEARESLTPTVDVVLLDRHLPDGSGGDVLDEIRQRNHDCSVAIVSASDPSADLDCDAYLTKPIGETDVLRETVSDLLGGRVSR